MDETKKPFASEVGLENSPAGNVYEILNIYIYQKFFVDIKVSLDLISAQDRMSDSNLMTSHFQFILEKND